MGAEPDASGGFHQVAEEELLRLHRVTVVRARFVAPDGSEFERDVIRDRRVVAMVPLLEDGETVLVVRQYRGPVDAWMVEIPAGLCDVDGEDDPEATAHRELVEEVGREAGRLELLARMHPSAGLTDCFEHLYLATELREVPTDRQGPEEEHMEVDTLSLRDVPRLVTEGALTDAKTVVGLMMARERLGVR